MHSALLLCFLIITQINEPACVDQSAISDPISLRAHHERQTMPYMPGTGRTAPSRHVQFGPHVSIQVNVDANGNNILEDAANEPSIAVDPTNPYRMAIGWRQFDSVLSSFRLAGVNHSMNAGRVWAGKRVLTPSVFRTDPVLDSDSTGRFFYYSLSGVNLDECDLFISHDHGITWSSPIAAGGGDKNWMVIDKSGGLGDGNIYCNWREPFSCCGDDTFTRSTNHGTLFEPTLLVPFSPALGTMSVDIDGTLYLAGVMEFDFSQFVIVKSSDAQNAAVTPSFLLSTVVSLRGEIGFFDGGPNPAGLLGQAWIASNRSQRHGAGILYLACSVLPFESKALTEVRFTRSNDGGFKWTDPIRINDNPIKDSTHHWFATMSVAPNGRIDVIWNDTRHSPNNFRFSELFYSSSSDGGITWTPNEQLSPAWDSHIGWPQQNKIGDYYHMVSDDLGANLAYAATFNGEQDIWFLRIGDYPCLGLITQQPASPSVCQGSTVSLRASADPRSGTVTYKWRKNGSPLTDSDAILGTQSPTLVFLNAQPSDTGNYDCYVKLADCGAEISHTATLTVFPTNTADGNLDSVVDGRDIALFVDSLVNFAPVSQPLCAYDLTGDGIVSDTEIAPFVTRLLDE